MDSIGKVEFEQNVERGAGLDVHEQTVVATIDGVGLVKQTRTFGTFTDDLRSLLSWLVENRVDRVAMESTGVYWKPVFNILSDSIAISLVNARHLKNVPGRKTDKVDSEWICKLLLSGLLTDSFIPEEKTRQLRDLNRYSIKLTEEMASEKNRIQKILEDANIKLSSVVSDTSGVVSRHLIDGLIAGNEDIAALVNKHYHGKLKASKQDLIRALTGRVTSHHRFMLSQIYSHILYLEGQIAILHAQMDELLIDDKADLALLETIPGVGRQGAVKIVSELGTDMGKFPSEKHLAKWAGMCPGNHESGGKKKVHA